MNTNGLISFDTPFISYVPTSFPLNGSLQLIAPFWGDVVIPPGSVWYREASSDSAILRRAQSDAQRYFMGLRNFRPSFVYIVTWERVGPFPGTLPDVSIKPSMILLVQLSLYK